MTTNVPAMCNKCHEHLAVDNSTLCQTCIDTFGQFHAKIVLEGVAFSEAGVVRDATGCERFLPPGSPIIGYWITDNNGDIWATLMSSVQAMQDSLTLKIIEVEDTKSKKAKSSGEPKVKKEKKVKETPTTTPVASREDQLAALRAMFPRKQ